MVNSTRESKKRMKHKKAIRIKISLYNLRLFSIELPIEHNIEELLPIISDIFKEYIKSRCHFGCVVQF